MQRTSLRSYPVLSRRGALAGIGSTVATLGLGIPSGRAAAQEATPTAPPDTIARERDVVYGVAEGQELLLDVARPPARDASRPAVVLVHGGAWEMGTDRTSMLEPALALAEDGYVTFNIDYRLTGDPAGEHPWPAQLDDVQRAVRWVRANAGRYGVDPDRIGAYGHSAGGHLAAMLGVRDTRDNSDPEMADYSSRVQAVVALAGQMDLNIPYADDFARRAVVTLLGGTPDEVPEAYRDASPITWVDAESAPFLIIHGGADPMISVEHARRMTDALHVAEVEVVSIEIPTGSHFSVAWWFAAGPWTRTFFSVTLHPER
jgi:acetyl esterase/lipase